MTPEQAERFFTHLDMVDAAAKQLDSVSKWTLLTDRPSGVLQWVTSVRLAGTLGGGVSVRLKTPASVWDRDVWGFIMPRKLQSPRERAARALCSSKGLPENTRYEGRPMWENFLSEVDVVLQAALSPEEWKQVKAEGPGK